MGENENIEPQIASSAFHNNAVFFIEVDKVSPNPYQPRREFDESRLNELAGSIRMYGVLQPLVVSRKEVVKEDGGMEIQYELIAGERRLRASKLAGLREVPALIRSKEDDEKTKLELAIIENLQREDLNPIDRARAFGQLAKEFKFKHTDIAKKVGRSREYVANTIRLLDLPEEMIDALSTKKITEGHARPLLMLKDRPEEQNVLFKEIIIKRMTVRDAEKVSRRIAVDKIRKRDRDFSPEIMEMEEKVSQDLGTRVFVEPLKNGGRISINYSNDEEMKDLLQKLNDQLGNKVPELNPDAVITPVTEKVIEEPEVATELDDVHTDFDTETLEDVDDEESFSLDNFAI